MNFLLYCVIMNTEQENCITEKSRKEFNISNMKCNICGAEIEYRKPICPYCGNTIVWPEPEPIPVPVKKPEMPKHEKRYCKICGMPLYDGEDCGYCRERERLEAERKRAVRLAKEREEKEMAERRRRKKKKQNIAKIVILTVLGLMILFAVSFSVFFKLLGGSFLPSEEEESPTPQVTSVAVTPQPKITEEPSAVVTKEPEATKKPKATKEPEKETQKPNSDVRTGGTYAYPSDSKIITRDELEASTRQQIKIILNEIYARHGYTFNDPDLVEYFESQRWYLPTVTNIAEIEPELSDIELENIGIIADYQREMGWRQ